MKNKKVIMLIIVGALLVATIVMGASYSLWTINHTQATTNALASGCFSITFADADNINLTNQYPRTDSNGLTLKPYTFTIKNTCTIASAYNINLETLSDTTASAQYIKVSLNSGTPALLSTYSGATTTITGALASKTLHTDYLIAGDSVTYTLRLWITEDATIEDMANKIFDSKIVVVSSATNDVTLANKLLAVGGGKSFIEAKTTPDFTNTAATDEGMFSATDDYGTSYYYRGAVTQNNVIFGGFCWKVIRINGNGTTRMIYNGTPSDGKCTATGDATQVGKTIYNLSPNDNTYVGYMYGEAGATTYEATHSNTNSSTAKTVVDNWYKDNLLSYDSKISDTLFCNDRSVASTAATWGSDDTAKGYGKNVTYYGAYNRRYNTHVPALTCQNKNDRFTVSDNTIGNAKLTYPIALITSDEGYMAGYRSYLNLSHVYWTMTPYDGSSLGTHVFSIKQDANVDAQYLTDEWGINPVINLNSDVLYTSGDGTSTTPYVIS
jgi:hypothetical protein